MTSRFLQLFKRGRYVSLRSLAAAETDDATRTKKHQERERFAVAAISFCLFHDKSFARNFLKTTAGLAPSQINEITVEPEHWGDLVLEGPRHVLVFEFKLGALLQDHQAPVSRLFSEAGYGLEILSRFRKSGKKLRYIVVGEDFRPLKRNGLPCRSVPWPRLLIASDQAESQIEKDLYDCLGHLGAAVFLNRHMKKPKLASDAQHTMNLCRTLHHVLEAECLHPWRSIMAPQYCGVEISRAGG